MMGTGTYGMYKVLFNIAFLLQFVHEPGIQSYNSQNIAKNPDQLGFHLPRILGLKSILFVLYFVLAIGYFFVSGFDVQLLPLMVVIAINLFLSTLFLYLRTNIAAIGKYRIDSLLSSLDKLLMLVILGVLSWVPPFCERFEIIWLAYGQLAAFALSCLVALWILRKQLGQLSIKFSFDYAKKLIKWSAPYALILLTMSAYTRMDSIMLEHILDDGGQQSGIYEYGYRFLDALNMVGYLFAALLLPMYAANIKDHRIIKDLVDTGFRMMVSLSLAYIFGSLLVANNSLRRFNILLIGGVLLNFALNTYLIPSEQALGAAKATFVTQTLMTIGQVILVMTILKVKIDTRLLFIVVGFGLFCALIF